jgi:NADH:ubiquinone oxidoreductase subunit
MKHLKLYENLYFKKDDNVILLYDSYTTMNEDFVINNLYKIRNVDKTDNMYPYCIYNELNDKSAWIKYNQIRLAEPYEINANKYNL